MATNLAGPLRPGNAPGGVSTDFEYGPLGAYPAQDPSKVHEYWNDFDNYVTGEWTETLGSGTIAVATATVDGGALVLTTVTTSDDAFTGAQAKGAFLGAADKRLWFKTRLQVDDATETDVVAGLYVTDTSPVASAPADGVYFIKLDGGLTVDLRVSNGGTTTTLSGLASMANATMIELAFAYDPNAARVDAFVNGIRVGSAPATNFPAGDLLRPSLGVQNGSAVGTRALTVDYVLAAKER
jgi:hypothetical protein